MACRGGCGKTRDECEADQGREPLGPEQLRITVSVEETWLRELLNEVSRLREQVTSLQARQHHRARALPCGGCGSRAGGGTMIGCPDHPPDVGCICLALPKNYLKGSPMPELVGERGIKLQCLIEEKTEVARTDCGRQYVEAHEWRVLLRPIERWIAGLYEITVSAEVAVKFKVGEMCTIEVRLG